MRNNVPRADHCEPPARSLVLIYTRFFHPPKVKLACAPGSSMTKQEFVDECNINNIVDRFVKRGGLSPSDVNKRAAMYADVADVDDLLTAALVVEAAEAGFMTLPAKVRERFGNDYSTLLAFLDDPKNRDEAISLGLLQGPSPVVVPAPAAPGTGAPEVPAAPGLKPGT